MYKVQTNLGPSTYSGFPARSLTRQIQDEGGEWITTYQAEQKRHLKAVMVSSKIESERSNIIFPPANTREASTRAKNSLSKQFLMKHCYVAQPNHLTAANISGYHLAGYVSSGLKEFTSLTSIEASDNHLSLEAFEAFPSLQSLELSLNSITDVFLNGEGRLVHLSYLDLSYNNLSAASLVALGSLPTLHELHVTGNNLVSLPSEMAVAFTVNGTEKVVMRYPELERLWLDDNKLCEDSLFAVLAGLRKLKYLNLNDNELCNIPQLKLLNTAPPKSSDNPLPSTMSGDIPRTDQEPCSIVAAPVFSLRHDNAKLKGADPGKSVARMETLFRTSQISPQLRLNGGCLRSPGVQGSSLAHMPPGCHSSPRTKQRRSDLSGRHPDNKGVISYGKHTHTKVVISGPEKPFQSDLDSSCVHEESNLNDVAIGPKEDELESSPIVDGDGGGDDDGAKVSAFPPFPKLEVLSLCNNLVTSAEGLVACESWPSLSKIIVRENPLIRTTKGLHPLLQDVLVEQQGIEVVRKKPKPQKFTTHIREKAKDLQKVSCAPPPAIPKYPLLPAIEAPPSLTSSCTPPHSQDHPGFNDHDRDAEHGYSPFGHQSLGSGSEYTSSQDSIGVFMTQVTTGEECSNSRRPSEGVTAKQEREPEGPLRLEEGVWSAAEAYDARLKELKEQYKDVDDRYRGYEVLLDDRGTDCEGITVPTDVLGCSRALQYFLKRPLIMSDCHFQPNAHTSTIAKNFQKQKKPVTSDGSSSRLPHLNKVLDEIKSQTATVETSVAQVFSPSAHKSAKQLRKECSKLLAEMQEHYDRVRSFSLEAYVHCDDRRNN